MATTARDKIEFLQFHQPALKDGDYTISVTHDVSTPSKTSATLLQTITSQNRFTSGTRKFSVLGPRFSLPPQDIELVFPPPGSLGDHANVLPHVIFKRSTLPWERISRQKNENVPWLALLVFTEKEAPQNATQNPLAANTLRTIEVSALNSSYKKGLVTVKPHFPKVVAKGTTSRPAFPGIELEFGDIATDKLTVIDVQWATLANLIPTPSDLQLLTHVRQVKDPNGELIGDELAVVIANRLPNPGENSTVHLVSLEGMYDENGHFLYPPKGNSAKDTDLIRLVSLHNWRFACLTEKESFKGLLMHLNHQLLFQIKMTAHIETELKAGSVPAEVAAVFTKINRALSGNEIISDRAKYHVTDSGSDYFISAGKKVYNLSGKLLFALNPRTVFPSAGQEAAWLTSTAKALFVQAGYALNKPSIKNVTVGPWWMTDGAKQYFLRVERTLGGTAIERIADPGALYVYALDSDGSTTLRMPHMGDNSEPYLSQGFVPLPHATRQGNRMVSWYHGPLAPGPNATANLDLPAKGADALVRFNPDTGMFDTSYAAAWELGRLLTLRSKKASVDLYNWKRTLAIRNKNNRIIGETEHDVVHLPLSGEPIAAPDLPKTVQDWFTHLSLFKDVPFHYLVPDDRMLPPESIRYFQVDPLWVNSLLDGAYSIGRVSVAEHQRDAQHGSPSAAHPVVTGILVRSAVVSGWPHLMVDAYENTLAPAYWRSFDPAFGVAHSTNFNAVNDGLAERASLADVGKVFAQLSIKLDVTNYVISSIRGSSDAWIVENDEFTQIYYLLRKNGDHLDAFRCTKFDSALANSFNQGDLSAVNENLSQSFNPTKTTLKKQDDTTWIINVADSENLYVIRRERVGQSLDLLIFYTANKLPLLRMDRLSKDVLICIFAGEAKIVDIHQKPEVLHFGVNDPDDAHSGYYKTLRLASGGETTQSLLIPWKKNDAKARIVNVETLKTSMKNVKALGFGDTFTAAEFALEMIEGVQKVRFLMHA